MKKKPTHGGKRKGAGRKAGSGKGRTRILKSVTMTQEEWDRLDDRRGVKTRGEYIAERI
jgi:hypothetical protein